MKTIERELDLARNAAAGDGAAFALLYDSYEKRIYNYCIRILGDQHDAEDATQEAFLRMLKRLPEMEGRDVEFGPYLFTTARNVAYDMIGNRKTSQPVADLPETGEGHLHRDDIDLESDPERAALSGSQRLTVQEANSRLPERQREVLALREIEEMSYEDIASTMELNSNSVAQLISRARTRLRSEMRLGSAAAVAPASADCEKALPLLAKRQDGEIGPAGDESWLGAHLAGCSTCRLAEEEMAEAGISYRAWTPVVPAAYLFRDTLAKASEVSGADWSGIERPAGQTPGGGFGWGAIAGAVATAIVVVGLVSAVLAGELSDSSRKPKAPEPKVVPVAKKSSGKKEGDGRKKGKRQKEKVATPDEVVVTESEVPVADFEQPSQNKPDGGGNAQRKPPGNPGGDGGIGSNPPSTAEPPAAEPDPPATPDPPPVDPPVVTPPGVTDPNPPNPNNPR